VALERAVGVPLRGDQDTNACRDARGASAAPTSTTPPRRPRRARPIDPDSQASATRSLDSDADRRRGVADGRTFERRAERDTFAAAAASPPATASDNGSNILLYAMLVAIGFLVLLSLFLSRGGRRRR